MKASMMMMVTTGEKLAIFLYTVNLEDDEPLAEQVDVLRGVEQEVVASAPVILPHGGEHIVDVEVGLLHLYLTFRQFAAVVVAHILVEGVERGDDAPVSPDTLDIGVHRTAQFAALRLRHFVVLRLPERQQQCLDAVLLLHVEHVIIGVERVERNRFLLRVGEIHAVRPVCLAPDHLAQALIGVSRVHQHHVRTLLVVLPHEVVHEKRLATARRTQHELVAVGGDAPLHRQVADVEVQRFSREPVHHLDAEGRERAAVVGFLREEAHRLLDEGVETLFRREVRRVAGHRRPVERRAVDGVVARHALHACQLAAHIVLDMLQFLRVIAPRHDVEVRPYRGQPVGMGFVQVLVYPLAVDAVAPAVSG